MTNSKFLIKQFNKVAKEYNIPPFKRFNELILGDYNFICDDFNFLNLSTDKKFQKENYIGPIYKWNISDNQRKTNDNRIEKFLNLPGKKILL